MRWVALVFATLAQAQLPDLKVPREAPEQPVPFSHKLHAGQGLKCAQCHPNPEPGDFMTLPKVGACMGCHTAVKKESPHIQKLAKMEKAAWTPVYRIPDWVSFNHKKHLSADGVSCEACHGKVAEMEAMRRVKDLSMAACMECHRAMRASNECLLCHDQR